MISTIWATGIGFQRLALLLNSKEMAPVAIIREALKGYQLIKITTVPRHMA